MNRDRFNNIAVGAASTASMAVINALQDYTPERQMAGITAVFLLACQHHGISPQDAFTVTKNCMTYAEKTRPEFKAVAAYMQGEWKKS